jgi:hypothetical protein
MNDAHDSNQVKDFADTLRGLQGTDRKSLCLNCLCVASGSDWGLHRLGGHDVQRRRLLAICSRTMNCRSGYLGGKLLAETIWPAQNNARH